VIHRIVRLASAAAVGIAFAAVGFGAPGSAASAATVTRSPVTAVVRPAGIVPGTSQHACTVIGNDGYYEGVICADLVTFGDGTWAVQAEGTCQTQSWVVPWRMVQCSDVHFARMNTSFQGDAGVSNTDNVYDIGCGHQLGSCPTSRYYAPADLSNYRVALFGCNDVWTVVYAGATIRLPNSGKTVTLATNLGSGHTTICDV
jgi:hypothetical protein